MTPNQEIHAVSTLRSLLFTPADRPERFEKALGSAADAVIFDWEDGVSPEAKQKARDEFLAMLYRLSKPRESQHHVTIALRINHLSTETGLRDLLALREAGVSPDLIVLPKVESVAEIDITLNHLPHPLPIAALIESAAGIESAMSIAAHPSVRAVALGAADLAAELGAELAWEPLLYARSRIVHTSAAAGICAWDVPFLDIKNSPGLSEETGRVKALGFTGKLAIHPNQLSVINEIFIPDADQIAKAQRIVDAFDASHGKVCVVDGKMVDLPVVVSARRLLATINNIKNNQQ